MSDYGLEHEMLESIVSGPVSPKVHLEHEKRLRREIANSNERRRMQSINSGFQSLKTLLPHQDGEKLSKAAILQHTAEYITSLEQEKTRLLSQNTQLKRLLGELGRDQDAPHASPPPKRKKRDTESSDEGIGMNDVDEQSLEEIRKEIIEVRCQLDRERRLRLMLEEQTRTLESQLYPERLRQIATQVQAQIRFQEEKERYLAEQRKMQEEEERKKVHHQGALLQNSMSRRNLETIVEAIKHLEGDRVLCDDKLIHHPSHDIASVTSSSRSSSDKEIMSYSDPEDYKSQTSGRDSPLSVSENCHHSASAELTHVKHEVHHTVSSERYPIAMQLLHRPNFSHHHHQFYQRPGVIVQNSS